MVQQISSAAVKQIPSTATLGLVCRTRKRRPLDNQPHEPNCAAPTAREHNERTICARPQSRGARVHLKRDCDAARVSDALGWTRREPGRSSDRIAYGSRRCAYLILDK